MESLDQIKARLEAAVSGVRLEIVPNPGPANQPSLCVDCAHAVAVAQFLCDDPQLQMDYASNVTGVDWPDRTVETRIRRRRLIDGVEREIEEVVPQTIPGYLEAVYHLYSMTLKQGPLILRQRTENRSDGIQVASLTPVWRSCELQEREVYDLFGVVFDGHPDLRRILMWEGFKYHPMRKDYVEPDDYEFEPTPHDEVLEKARRHYAQEAKS